MSSACSHIIKTHELLLRKLVRKDLLRTYAYYLKFKYQYTSSRLNNGNRAHLSRETGLSEKNIRTQISKLLDLGWAKRDGNDIIFIRLQDIYKQQNLPLHRFANTCTFTTTRQVTIKQLIALLGSKLLEANLERQRFMMQLRSHRDHSGEKGRAIHSKDKNVRKLSYVPNNLNGSLGKTVMSCNGFGRLLGRGTTSGANVKQLMLQMGLIEAETHLRLIRPNVDRKVFDNMQKFNYSGYRFYNSCERNIYQRGTDYISMTIA